MTPGLRAELERLLSTLVDDELSDAEHARLEELLLSDAECRRLYLEYVDLHVRLSHHPRLSTLLDEPAADVRNASPSPPAAESLRPVRLPQRWAPLIVTAALTLAASVAVQLSWRADSAPSANPAASELAPTQVATHDSQVPTYVATLSKAVDCEWDRDDPLRIGMRLLPGAVRLRSGTAQLQFDGGAQLVLSGPTVLDLKSATSAEIVSGDVLFRSDDTAEPFHLHTPTARLIDYGTEYAVALSADGEEVHVFDGEVRRSPRSSAPVVALAAVDAVAVLAGEARRFQPLGDVGGKAVPLDAARLKVLVDFIPPPPESGLDKVESGELLAYEPFACKSTSLPCPKSGGGRGFTTPWTKACKSEVVPEFRVVDSLWRPQMQTATQGGGVSAGCRGAISRRLANPIRMDEDAVYYVSYLIRSEKRSSDEPCDVQLVLRDHAVSEPQRKLAVTASWSKSKTSLCWEGGGNCASIPVEPGKTYLVACKIVAGRTAPDQAFLCLFVPRQPVPASEPASWTLQSRPVLSDMKFDVVQISANTSTPVLIDELRFGTSWSAVAGVYSAP